MRTDRGHFRRPEGVRGSSVARRAGYRRHFAFPATGTPAGRRAEPDSNRLVEEALNAALEREVRIDPTFGDYASLGGFFRSAEMQDGRLLETALDEVLKANPNLLLLPPKAMPIVPAATEMLKRTPLENTRDIRFPARVHSTESYTPDKLVVHRGEHVALILDLKRDVSKHRPQEIRRLCSRMASVVAIAPEWLAEHCGQLVVEVQTAIIDGADKISDHERRIFRLSEIDQLLDTEGAAEFVARTREKFSRRVQQEFGRQCHAFAVAGGFRSPEISTSNPVADAAASAGTVVPIPAPAARQPRFGFVRQAASHH